MMGSGKVFAMDFQSNCVLEVADSHSVARVKTFPTPIIQLGWQILIEFDFAIAIGLLFTVTTA